MLRAPRTPLSKQAGILRTTLLLSLGLSPLACGGSTAVSGNGGGSGGQAQNTGGQAIDPPWPFTGGHSPVEHSGGTSGYSEPAGGGPPAGSGGTWTAGTGGLWTAGTSSGGNGGSGGTLLGPTDCPNPVYNPTTKLTECSNGRRHRPMSTACTFTNGGGAPGIGGAGIGTGGTGFPTICQSDAECAGLPSGPGVCQCDGVYPGRCIDADCFTDADCGLNTLCALGQSDVCAPATFQCTSPQDQCINGSDCRGTCVIQNGHRACNPLVCGRPFVIAEQARVAEVEARADWLDPTLTVDPSALTPLERAQLAAHWARLGQLEHASIAAFARFNLQLLSLGAPGHLVEACNRALADETAHARSCFALASAYGGTAVGPARLDVEHCFEDMSLTAIAKLVLREGCLGETVAALEAVAAAEVASDPVVKRALERIASDELSHADLAFQFLRWALSLSSPEERYELACEAAQQLADFESDARHGERTPTDDRLAAHGLLGSEALGAIHLAAARDVSRPLLAALFEQEPSEA